MGYILKNEQLNNDLRNALWHNEEKKEKVFFFLNKYEEMKMISFQGKM